MMSKSFLTLQKLSAISPAQKVRRREQKAKASQFLLFLLYKAKLINPVIEIRISSGKNDQFHATRMGFS